MVDLAEPTSVMHDRGSAGGTYWCFVEKGCRTSAALPYHGTVAIVTKM